jgi:uncharacterized coiled-coil protein SlyX
MAVKDTSGAGQAPSVAELSRALEEARAEIDRLRQRVRGLERELPNRQAGPQRTQHLGWTRHQVDEALALRKYGCSLSEISERLNLKEEQLRRILHDPQRARAQANPT